MLVAGCAEPSTTARPLAKSATLEVRSVSPTESPNTIPMVSTERTIFVGPATLSTDDIETALGGPLRRRIRKFSNRSLYADADDMAAFHARFRADNETLRREFFPGEPRTYRIRWHPTVTITPEAQETGEVRLPLTVVLQYSEGGTLQRISQSTTVRITIDNTRLRRRVDSKLNLLMGAVPKGLRS